MSIFRDKNGFEIFLIIFIIKVTIKVTLNVYIFNLRTIDIQHMWIDGYIPANSWALHRTVWNKHLSPVSKRTIRDNLQALRNMGFKALFLISGLKTISFDALKYIPRLVKTLLSFSYQRSKALRSQERANWWRIKDEINTCGRFAVGNRINNLPFWADIRWTSSCRRCHSSL